MIYDLAECLEIRAAHRFSDNRFSWHWGWCAVDTSDSSAVGIVTAHQVTTPVPEVRIPYAVVNIVYARKHSGLGVNLLVHARDELARWDAGPVTLYRSGTSTPKGQAACDAAELALDPQRQHLLDVGKLELLPYKEEHAIYWGRRHLETAADWFCIRPIPVKAEEIGLLNRLPEGYAASTEVNTRTRPKSPGCLT
ncbi:hypothetical protein [Nocardia sp. NPDC004711]